MKPIWMSRRTYHAGKESGEAKYWLNPITLARTRGFREHELNEIERIIMEHQNDLLDAWEKEIAKRGNR